MQKRKGPISIADIAAKVPKKQQQSKPVAAPSTWSAKDAYKFITEQKKPVELADSEESSVAPPPLAPIEAQQAPDSEGPKPLRDVSVAQIGSPHRGADDSFCSKLGTNWEQSSNKVGTGVS